jgi:RNA polymerase sigma-70 factor (ECF subfamily)
MSADTQWAAGVGGFAELADPYRGELLAHCYRMVGSIHDAEDLVQETLLRAWRGYGRFDGRSSLRTWLYRIATNTCLTALGSSHRRVLPSGLGPGTSDSESADLRRLDDIAWLEPAPTSQLTSHPADPAAIVTLRDSTRLALVAAFQRLPARQRAALMLVDVVGYTPKEAAELLGVAVTAVRSLLQRARAALAADTPIHDEVMPSPELDSELLERYLRAFETADTDALAQLLADDVQYEMPPVPVWFSGRNAVMDHHVRRVFTRGRRGVATSANGYPALATYTEAADGAYAAHGIHVIETEAGRITRVIVFLGRDLFPAFGLTSALPASSVPAS